jgi:tripartite-type tricarboxylate transporter receptor subunit TctC
MPHTSKLSVSNSEVRRLVLKSLILSSALLSAAGASAQGDTLRFIVPFPAGGAADTLGRALVEKLKDEMKATIVVENRPGASTRLAAEMLKQAPPDGKTVLLTILDTTSIAPLIYSSLRYDAAKDFAPISMVCDVLWTIAVKGDGPYKTLPQFLEAARAKKDQAIVGVSGLGGTGHFLAVDFVRLSKAADMTVVPFQGGPAMVTNMLGNQLPAAVDGLGVFVQHHKAGKLRVLAVANESRTAQLPDVPTFKELGMPLTIGTSYALYTTAGTPAAKIDEWNRAMRKVLATPEMKQRLLDIGYGPLDGTSPAEVTAREARMREHWAPIIKATGFKGD